MPVIKPGMLKMSDLVYCIEYSENGVDFSGKFVKNPTVLDITLRIRQCYKVSDRMQCRVETGSFLSYFGGEEREFNRICFKFRYDVATDTIRDIRMCEGAFIVNGAKFFICQADTAIKDVFPGHTENAFRANNIEAILNKWEETYFKPERQKEDEESEESQKSVSDSESEDIPD